MANQQQIKNKKHKQNPTKGETQIPQPDMRFDCREAKQTAKGAGPNKNTHDQKFDMDTVVEEPSSSSSKLLEDTSLPQVVDHC